MEVFSFVFALDFKKDTAPVLEKKKADFLDFFSKGKFDKSKLPQMGLNVNDVQTKTICILEEQKIAIGLEVNDVEEIKVRVAELLERIYTDFAYSGKEILRIGARVQWMHPWESSFTKLVEQFKNSFYLSNSLVNESSDVAINFTLNDRDSKVNFIAGPMRPEQGKDLLTFKERHLPHDFIFIDVDRYKTTLHNDVASIKGFIANSIEYSKTKADETINSLIPSKNS